MRYLPPRVNGTDPDAHFTNYRRPADADLPPDLVKLMAERDRLAGLHSEQYAECQRLRDQTLDNQARLDDDRIAGEAVRAGKPMPDPTAVPALASQRADAARTLAAYADAVAQVREDTERRADEIHRENITANLEANEKARRDAAKLLEQLLAVVEGNIRARAIDEWYGGSDYQPKAQVAIDDILATAAPAVDVRQLITHAITTVLEDSHA